MQEAIKSKSSFDEQHAATRAGAPCQRKRPRSHALGGDGLVQGVQRVDMEHTQMNSNTASKQRASVRVNRETLQAQLNDIQRSTGQKCSTRHKVGIYRRQQQNNRGNTEGCRQWGKQDDVRPASAQHNHVNPPRARSPFLCCPPRRDPGKNTESQINEGGRPNLSTLIGNKVRSHGAHQAQTHRNGAPRKKSHRLEHFQQLVRQQLNQLYKRAKVKKRFRQKPQRYGVNPEQADAVAQSARADGASNVITEVSQQA